MDTFIIHKFSFFLFAMRILVLLPRLRRPAHLHTPCFGSEFILVRSTVSAVFLQALTAMPRVALLFLASMLH